MIKLRVILILIKDIFKSAYVILKTKDLIIGDTIEVTIKINVDKK